MSPNELFSWPLPCRLSQRDQPPGASNKYRAGSRLPSPSLNGSPGKAENQFSVGDLRNPGVLNLGSSGVSRIPRQDTGAREREGVVDPRKVKLDRRADGASGKRLGKGRTGTQAD